jgi:hypothetical protein
MEDTVTSNGRPAEEAALPVASESPAIAGLRSEMAVLVKRREELLAAINAITPELKRYEKALAFLTGEIAAPKKKAAVQKRDHTRVSDDRVELIRRAILLYARDHEEFRQVDLRTATGFTSSVMATSFEKLRQTNVIRFARQDGNNKWYRLTREAVGKP